MSARRGNLVHSSLCGAAVLFAVVQPGAAQEGNVQSAIAAASDELRANVAAGIARAQVDLAQHLSRAGFTNSQEAVDLLTAAARQGDPRALYLLGLAHEINPSLERSRSLPLIERAAQLGHDSAARYAAMQLIDGVDGVQRDPERAVALLTLAADRGSVEATIALAEQVVLGRIPVEFAAAAERLAKIAEDHAPARFWLGVLLQKGVGVEQELERGAELERSALAAVTTRERMMFAALLSRAAPDVRDLERAVRLIEADLLEPGNRSAENLNLLAAVYALSGRFPEAVAAQEEALAELAYNDDLASRDRGGYERRLRSYRDGNAGGNP